MEALVIDQRPTHYILVEFGWKLDGNLVEFGWKSVCKLLRVTEMNGKEMLDCAHYPYIMQTLIFTNKLN